MSWTNCSCGHIAQAHNIPVLHMGVEAFKCDDCKDCPVYDGEKKKETIINHYFKFGKGLISGIHIEGAKDKRFLECEFHPNTWSLPYENCVFENCGLDVKRMVNAKGCTFIRCF